VHRVVNTSYKGWYEGGSIHFFYISINLLKTHIKRACISTCRQNSGYTYMYSNSISLCEWLPFHCSRFPSSCIFSPSFFSSPLSLPFRYTRLFSPAAAKGSGEHLSSPAGPGGARLPNDIIWAEKCWWQQFQCLQRAPTDSIAGFWGRRSPWQGRDTEGRNKGKEERGGRK